MRRFEWFWKLLHNAVGALDLDMLVFHLVIFTGLDCAIFTLSCGACLRPSYNATSRPPREGS
jgi:hypothetical protein